MVIQHQNHQMNQPIKPNEMTKEEQILKEGYNKIIDKNNPPTTKAIVEMNKLKQVSPIWYKAAIEAINIALGENIPSKIDMENEIDEYITEDIKTGQIWKMGFRACYDWIVRNLTNREGEG